jgi:predicted PurR-regulated permease PerM
MAQVQSLITLGFPARFSYGFMLVGILLAGWLHLGIPIVAALFSYLTLKKLQVKPSWNPWYATAVFTILLIGMLWALTVFVNRTVKALPEIAQKVVPSVIETAKRYEIELPFTDYDSMREIALDTATSQVKYIGSFARFAQSTSRQFLLLIVGCIAAIGFFLNPQLDLKSQRPKPPNNLYSLCCTQLLSRFATFYHSFATVMGAQIIISTINTSLTAIFVAAVNLPYAVVVIGVTFLCGMIPVLGNLISNTIIVSIGFTVSPSMALIALGFLIAIHKLEYFLNSQIIGNRIEYPLWATLLGIVVGERLMGIPGMILAPVILHYIKSEATALTLENDSYPRELASSQS